MHTRQAEKLLDRDGNPTRDLWFTGPLLYQLSHEVKSVQGYFTTESSCFDWTSIGLANQMSRVRPLRAIFSLLGVDILRLTSAKNQTPELNTSTSTRFKGNIDYIWSELNFKSKCKYQFVLKIFPLCFYLTGFVYVCNIMFATISFVFSSFVIISYFILLEFTVLYLYNLEVVLKLIHAYNPA